MLAVVLVAATFVVAIDAAPSAPRVSPSAQATRGALPHFAHVVVVVFENRSSEAVLGYRGAPTFNRLAARYALLRNYRAVAHPSLPNYLALVSGSTHGIRNDCVSCLVGGASLADTIRRAGLTWRAYVEGYKGPGARPAHAIPFFARIPFLRFDGVTDSTRQLRDIQPLSSFTKAVRAGRLPSFSLVVPNLCHDMHYCSIATGDRWLRGFVGPLLRSPAMQRSVLFVTFDEGESRDHLGGGGPVSTIVAGPLVRPHVQPGRPYTHYSLLRTIEDAWGLPRLGQSATAAPITGIWRVAR
ncbi:MAG: alkaline phosphatase family protein [Gaiellaceae bacterium]